MLLSKTDISRIYNGIEAIQGLEDKYSPQFTYALSRNKRVFQGILESVQETEYTYLSEYFEEVNSLNKKYGEQVKKPNAYEIPEGNREAYTKEKDAIREKHKEAIEANSKFINEKEEVVVYEIKEKDFPELTGSLADQIYELREQLKTDKR